MLLNSPYVCANILKRVGGAFARALICLAKQRKGRRKERLSRKLKRAREIKGLARRETRLVENIDQDLYCIRGRWIASGPSRPSPFSPPKNRSNYKSIRNNIIRIFDSDATIKRLDMARRGLIKNNILRVRVHHPNGSHHCILCRISKPDKTGLKIACKGSIDRPRNRIEKKREGKKGVLKLHDKSD